MVDIRNCPKCGGTHYGSRECPMTEGHFEPMPSNPTPTTHVAIERGELERLRGALQEIVDLGNKTLLGPRHDTERFHELGSAKAYADCADIARAALAKEPTT